MSVPANTEKFAEMVAEFNDIVEQTYYLEQKVYEWNKKIEANKRQISKEMGRKKIMGIRVDQDTSFTVEKKTETKIEFYEDQIIQNVDKKVHKQVIQKTYVIDELPKLVKLLKRYGVDSGEFKNYITTHKKVDTDALDQLLEIGEIEIKDLQGCYKAEFNEDIRVRKNK